MTEQEWAVAKDPKAMMDHLVLELVHDSIVVRNVPLISDRKARLFACACSLDEPAWVRWATEGGVPGEYKGLDGARYWSGFMVGQTVLIPTKEEKVYRANLLREIVGNPFRPVARHDLYKTGDRDAPESVKDGNGEVVLGLCRRCGKGEAELSGPCSWVTSTVMEMAKYAYDNSDFSGLPYIADALEEAGCGDLACRSCDGRGWLPGDMGCPACGATKPGTVGTGRLPHPILTHLRNSGSHVRGCHVLDFLLGLE